MNQWQRLDEDIKQLTLARKNSQSIDNNIGPGTVTLSTGQVLTPRSMEGGEPDWQLSWKPEHNPEVTDNSVQEIDTSHFRPESSLAQSSTLLGSTDDAHTVYDIDFELDKADQRARTVAAESRTRALQQTDSTISSRSSPAYRRTWQ